jgi:hypothetical protein
VISSSPVTGTRSAIRVRTSQTYSSGSTNPAAMLPRSSSLLVPAIWSGVVLRSNRSTNARLVSRTRRRSSNSTPCVRFAASAADTVASVAGTPGVVRADGDESTTVKPPPED